MVYVPVTGDDYDATSYSRDAFYTTDTGGGIARARVSDEVMRSIHEVVRDPLFVHYHTASDFVRDAVIHHLHYRREQLSDPGLAAAIEHRLEQTRRMQMIVELDEWAKSEERVASIIANRYWKATDRKIKQSFYIEARKLRSSGTLDDHLKDELNRVITNWVARVAEEDDVKIHGEPSSHLI